MFPLTQDKTSVRSDLSSDIIPASMTHAKSNLSQQHHDIPENTFSPVCDQIISDNDSELDDSNKKSKQDEEFFMSHSQCSLQCTRSILR